MKASLLVSTRSEPDGRRTSVAAVPVHRVQVGLSLACFVAWCLVCVLVMWASPSHAQETKPQDLQAEVASLLQARVPQVSDEATLPGSNGAAMVKPRVEVVLGQLDPRLKLAPCEKVRTYMPDGVNKGRFAGTCPGL